MNTRPGDITQQVRPGAVRALYHGSAQKPLTYRFVQPVLVAGMLYAVMQGADNQHYAYNYKPSIYILKEGAIL